MRYRIALASSLNISAVIVPESIGAPEPLQRFLQKGGFSKLNGAPDEYGLGLTIGSSDGHAELQLRSITFCTWPPFSTNRPRLTGMTEPQQLVRD
jgi:membrane carboxypeptidase/penicillin-binding protein PbpC